MLAGNNFLLLDEPTNHLDMHSREVLEASLEEYTGTLLMISHDRYFLNKIANRILVMEENGITQYLGNFDDYLEKKKSQELLDSLEKEEPAEKTKTAQKEERKKEREERQKRRAFQQLLKDLENKIHKLEEELSILEALLYDPDLYSSPDKMLEVQQQYNHKKTTLDAAYEEWLELNDSSDGE